MNKYEKALNEIEGTMDRLKELYDFAYKQYALAVEGVLQRKLTSQREIEQLLDGLLDFGEDERFRVLYRKLCRHVFYTYPEMVGDYVSLFRAQFEGFDDEENQN